MPPGNRQRPNQTGLFFRRVLSIQQDESLATPVIEWIAEQSAPLPERSLVIECPRNPWKDAITHLRRKSLEVKSTHLNTPSVPGHLAPNTYHA